MPWFSSWSGPFFLTLPDDRPGQVSKHSFTFAAVGGTLLFLWTGCNYGAELGQTLSCIKLSLKQQEIPTSFSLAAGHREAMLVLLLFLARGHPELSSSDCDIAADGCRRKE